MVCSVSVGFLFVQEHGSNEDGGSENCGDDGDDDESDDDSDDHEENGDDDGTFASLHSSPVHISESTSTQNTIPNRKRPRETDDWIPSKRLKAVDGRIGVFPVFT